MHNHLKVRISREYLQQHNIIQESQRKKGQQKDEGNSTEKLTSKIIYNRHKQDEVVRKHLKD